MIANHFLLAFFWIVYCVVHSLLADLSIKEKLKKIMADSYKYYRLIYTIFAFASFLAILWFAILIPSFWLYQPKIFLLIIGILTGFCGCMIMIACIPKYLPSVSGIKNISKNNFTNQLIVTGMHRYIRHPLYLGTFLFLWGLFIILPYLSFLISNIIITAYTLIGIQLEEKKLELEFGESYRQYKQKVPKLIPAFNNKMMDGK
jgi:protein-S-isoprenylcysteine O-methyltransferase Ste14